MTDIAFVIEGMGGGGAQQVLARVAESLIENGKSVTLITFRPKSEDQVFVPTSVVRIVAGAVKRRSFPLAGVAANLTRISRLRKAIVASAAPVIVGMVGTTNILVILASLGLKRRVVISERNDPSRQSLGWIWDYLRKRLYPCADLVTANSDFAVVALKRFVPPERVLYLPNPVRRRSSREVAPKFGPTLLAVGRLHEQKGYDFLLEGFAQFAKRFPEWRLRILGDGSLRRILVDQAAFLGIADRVEWAGYCADPFPHYFGCDVFVMTSRFEGTPNALLEAMSCALPSVISDELPGAVALIRDGENGFIYRAGSVENLVSALCRLAGEELLRRRLGVEAARNEALDSRCAIAAWESGLFSNADI